VPGLHGAAAGTTLDLLRLLGYPAAEEVLGPSVRPLARLLAIEDRWAPAHWDEWDRLYEHNRSLVLMASVGSLKSSWMVLLKARRILQDPAHTTILHASSTDRLARRMVMQLQGLLTSAPIVEVFGDLEGDLWNSGEFAVRGHDPLIKTPTCVAVGVGGAIEGDRFLEGHMDDPLELQDAVSEVTREAKVLWYRQTFFNRINWYDQRARLLAIGSRWHRNDLYHQMAFSAEGQPTADVAYRVFPAILEGGAMGFPDLYSAKVLRGIRDRIGQTAFDMRYQCSATAMEGQLFKVAWLANFWADQGQVPPWSELDIVQGWDLAFTEKHLVGPVGKPKTDPDWTVCVTLGIHRPRSGEGPTRFWLLHLYRVQIAGGHKRHIEALWQKFRPRKVYVEVNAYKTIKWEFSDSMVPLQWVDQNVNKVVRIMDLQPYFERDLFRMQRDLKHADALFHEYEQFPHGAHEDVLDALRTSLRGYIDEGEEWFGSLRPAGGRV